MILSGTIHELPEVLISTLKENLTLLEKWNSLTELARNEWICYITIPKKEETKSSRLERLKEDITAGKKRPCCWPGCPHHRPNAEKWFKNS
ncbi:YdeI/OmpD-associated family protein [Candidatus Gracilibacteria bacterium]|nr:YdeI/OmpD-associated family protein [Candidatus Gracilibacteria bacterium]